MPETDVVIKFLPQGDEVDAYIRHLVGDFAAVTHAGREVTNALSLEPEIQELMQMAQAAQGAAGATESLGKAAAVTVSDGLEPEIAALMKEAAALKEVEAASKAGGLKAPTVTAVPGMQLPPTYSEFGGKTYEEYVKGMQQGRQATESAAGAQDHLNRSMHEGSVIGEQWNELLAGIGYSLGAWNVGFMLADQAIKGVTEAIKSDLDAERAWVQQANITNTTQAEQNERFERLKKAAAEAGMTFKEFTEFANPLIRALENIGESEDQAGLKAKTLGQIFKATGIDMREVAEKAELGVAGFDDFVRVGAVLGPQFQQWAASWREWEQQISRWNVEVRRSEMLEQGLRRDMQRLSDAQDQFAQKTGVSAAVFKGMQDALAHGLPSERLQAQIQVPAAFAGRPEVQAIFRQLAEKERKELEQGLEQMSKELGLSVKTLRVGMAAGMPGLDEQSLQAAAKRAQEEERTAKQREIQALRAQDEIEKTNAIAYGNEQIRKAVQGTVKEQEQFKRYMESTPGQIDKATVAMDKFGDSIGAAVQKAKEGIPDLLLFMGTLGQWGSIKLPGAPAAPFSPLGPPGSPNVTPGNLATDKSVQAVTEAINALRADLRGSGSP